MSIIVVLPSVTVKIIGKKLGKIALVWWITGE